MTVLAQSGRDLSNRVIKGEHSYGDVKVPWGGKVTIGKYCSIAGGVIAAILSDHRMDWVSTYPFAVRWGSKIEGRSGSRQNPDVIVENDVWIGLGTVLLENTHLRNGSVVGSYSVVHGEVPPYCIAVGNPAKVVRKRFTDEQIEKLLKIAWWDWPDEKVLEYVPLLCGDDIDLFINTALGESNG